MRAFRVGSFVSGVAMLALVVYRVYLMLDVATTARALPGESRNLMDEAIAIILSGSIWPAVVFGLILCALSFVPDRIRKRMFDSFVGRRQTTVRKSISGAIDAARNVTTLDEARSWKRQHEPMIVAVCGRQEWDRFCREIGEPQPRRAVDFGRSAATYLISLADRIDSGVPAQKQDSTTFNPDALAENLTSRIPKLDDGEGRYHVQIMFVSLRDKVLCDKVMLAFDRAGWWAGVNGGPIAQYSHDAQISGIRVSGIDEGICKITSSAMSDAGLESVFYEVDKIPEALHDDEEWIDSRRKSLRVMIGYQPTSSE